MNWCRNYILNKQGKPVVERNLIKWAMWFEKSELRRVALDKVGKSQISTVFLGLDHNWSRKGPPVLWETMVFGGKLDQECDRCSGTKEQAEAMHQRMVNRVKGQK